MPTLRERLENNLPLFFLATLATGFAAGFGALRAIQEANDSIPVPRAMYEQLRREAEIGRQGQTRASVSVASPTTSIRDSTSTETIVSAPKERRLDGAVPLLTSAHCWDYHPEPISIGGKLFSDYAVIDYGCDEGTALTFDVRGWDRFEGTVGITANDARSNNLTVKTDADQVDVVDVSYRTRPHAMNVPLTGHDTLTFSKSGRYPEVFVGEPRLRKN